MNRQRKTNLSIIIVLFAMLASACGSLRQPGAAPDIGTILVGYLPSTSYAPYFIGVEKGFFEEQGLKVELQSFQSGSVMIAPLSTGQLDVGAGEVGPALIHGVGQGLDVRVVAGQGSAQPGYGSIPFMVRKDLVDSGEVSDPADLKGRKVAINIGRGQSEYLVAKALEKGGLTIDDVELVILPFPDIPAAFANGAIDAALMNYPNAAKIVEAGDGVVFIAGDELAPGHQTTMIYFGRRLLDPANREIAIRFLIGYLNAVRDIHGEGWKKEENLAIISKYTKIPTDVLEKSVKTYTDPNGELLWETAENVQEYYFSRGYLEIPQPLTREQMAEDSFLEEAVKRIGEFKE